MANKNWDRNKGQAKELSLKKGDIYLCKGTNLYKVVTLSIVKRRCKDFLLVGRACRNPNCTRAHLPCIAGTARIGTPR